MKLSKNHEIRGVRGSSKSAELPNPTSFHPNPFRKTLTEDMVSYSGISVYPKKTQ